MTDKLFGNKLLGWPFVTILILLAVVGLIALILGGVLGRIFGGS